MTECTHNQTQAVLDTIFIGDEAEDILMTRAHLHECVECRTYFNTLVQLEQGLMGEDDFSEELEEGEEGVEYFAQRFSNAVMRASVRAVAMEAAHERGPGVWQRLQRWWQEGGQQLFFHTGLPAMAAVALVAGGAFWLGPLLGQDAAVPPETSSTFQERSATLPNGVHAPSGSWRLEAFCAWHQKKGEAGEKMMFRSAHPETGELLCGQDDELKFAALNHTTSASKLTYLTMLGVSEKGGLLWYRPLPTVGEGEVSMQVRPTTRVEPLGETIRLSVHHKPGNVALFGIFSAAPLKADALESRVQQWHREGRSGKLSVEGLPVRTSQGERLSLGQPGLGEYVVRHTQLQITEPRGHDQERP